MRYFPGQLAPGLGSKVVCVDQYYRHKIDTEYDPVSACPGDGLPGRRTGSPHHVTRWPLVYVGGLFVAV